MGRDGIQGKEEQKTIARSRIRRSGGKRARIESSLQEKEEKNGRKWKHRKKSRYKKRRTIIRSGKGLDTRRAQNNRRRRRKLQKI